MSSESHEKQKIEEGYGAPYHRIYSVSIPAPFSEVQKALRDLKGDPNQFSPQLLAKFEKTKGDPGELKVGDEFQIYITGPWNGPVKVTQVTDTGFRFATLEGHLEAGEIRFVLKADGETRTCFLIESLARSRDAIVDFVYDKVPIAKFAQTEMWTAFCKSFAEHATKVTEADADKIGEVEVLTERRDEETGQWQKL